MLPRAKSRPITVAGIRYRWLVSDAAARAVLLVETNAGARLEVPLRREEDGLYWWPLPDDPGPGPLTPRIVARLIEAAHAQGWQPAEPGPVFRFRPPSPALEPARSRRPSSGRSSAR